MKETQRVFPAVTGNDDAGAASLVGGATGGDEAQDEDDGGGKRWSYDYTQYHFAGILNGVPLFDCQHDAYVAWNQLLHAKICNSTNT